MSICVRPLRIAVFCCWVTACTSAPSVPPPPNAQRVMAAIETTPVTSRDDAADDPVIWVHPQNPEASLVIGTDKQFGIEVYNLAGERVQSVAAGRTNNVDLRMLADGGTWSAIAAASNRTTNTISLFAIDLEGRLTWLRDSEVETGLTEPYGLCMFSNEFGLQVFVNDTDGRYQQWLLIPRADSTDLAGIDSRLLREFTVPSQPEGCVADDANQRLFIGVEDEGIRLIQANHLEPARLQSLANIDGNRLVADVEGMSLYLDGARGYLVVSSQGNYSYAVFDRLPPYHYRGSFVVVDSETTAVDGTEETDGLDISSLLRTSAFPDGMLVVQDGYNRRPRSSQNFKFISWQQVRSALSLD